MRRGNRCGRDTILLHRSTPPLKPLHRSQTAPPLHSNRSAQAAQAALLSAISPRRFHDGIEPDQLFVRIRPLAPGVLDALPLVLKVELLMHRPHHLGESPHGGGPPLQVVAQLVV